MRWKVAHTLDIPDYDIKCASWSPFGNRFLVSGVETRLFELEHGKWIVKWKTTNPSEVTMVSFSPDERLFATAGKNNRIVKIWFQNELSDQKEHYSFIYLPHQRAVKSIEWRPINKTKKFLFITNVSQFRSKCVDDSL
jgi:WD40 repeat protein